MITIAGAPAAIDTSDWPPAGRLTYERKRNSPVVYRYDTPGQLRFEADMRTAIVGAAEALSRSGLRFSDFERARCNGRLWRLTPEGGFRIREDATPAAGIRDIFQDGGQYATECATATVIAVYRGVLDAVGEAHFNRLFAGLLLYDWHTDDDLRLSKRKGVADACPGDLLYFNNPDFDPSTPQWRGENVILLGEDRYYGHPFGIAAAQRLIDGLNRTRRPGSTTPAYLMDDVVSPDYLYLSRFAAESGAREPIRAHIGGRRYVR